MATPLAARRRRRTGPAAPLVVSALSLVLFTAAPAASQGPIARVPWPTGAESRAFDTPWATSSVPTAVSPPIRILASALLPGLGQAVERRWLSAALFTLVEGAGWWIHLDAERDADRFRDGYRDLAWSTARGRPAPRIDGPFEYYERMIHWTRSGVFDADPTTPGVQPERDADAFNGRQWRLAADIFLGGDVSAPPTAPGYGQAVAWYRDRAYGDAFLWDWTGAEAEQQRFARLVDDTDAASRRASVAAGALVANHVLSAVEVFVAQRLGRQAVELEVAPPSRESGGAATFRVRIPVFR